MSSTGWLVNGPVVGPGRAAASSTALFYTPNDRRSVVLKVPKTGGAEETVYVAPGTDPRITAITFDDESGQLAVAYQENRARWVKPPSGPPVVVPTSNDISDIVVAKAGDPTTPRLYVVTEAPSTPGNGEVFKLTESGFSTSGTLGGTSLAVDANNVYVGSNVGVTVLQRDLTFVASPTSAPKNTAFAATNDGVIYAGGNTTSSVLVSLSGSTVANIRSNLAVRPIAIAVDEGYIYYAGGDGGMWRVSRFPVVSEPKLLKAEGVGASIPHVFVDPPTATGCIYYWVRDSEAGGRLVVRPKTQL